MRHACAAALVAVLVLVGAGPAQADRTDAVGKLARGELTAHVLVPPDGVPRTYWLYEPPGLSRSTPVPLVVVLHGGGGDGLTYEDWTRFDAVAARDGFVVAYPDGFGRSWNARTCCFLSWRLGLDDVGYAEALVDSVAARRPIDPARVYAAGHSNGAMLADVIACESGRFAAVAAVSGAMGPPCDPPRPVSVLHIHGTADTHAPYDGGVGSDGLTGTVHYPVRDDVAAWRARLHCPDPVVAVSGVVTSEISEGCDAGTAVALYTIDGGTHPWPGSSKSSPLADPPSQALDATSVVWDFFKAHPRQGG